MQGKQRGQRATNSWKTTIPNYSLRFHPCAERARRALGAPAHYGLGGGAAVGALEHLPPQDLAHALPSVPWGGRASSNYFNRANTGRRTCDYARAQAAGVTCVPLLVETFGGLSPTLMRELRAAAEWRSNKLTSSEYDETT